MNTSIVDNLSTANTQEVCAKQRALTLHKNGVKEVIELCVGPSLKILEESYKEYGINCIGNDIEKRWQIAYPQGK